MEDYKITDLLEELRNDDSWETNTEMRNMIVTAFTKLLSKII